MSLIKDSNNNIFKPYSYTLENEFEKDVILNAKDLFGEASVYLDIKKQVRGNNIITIPDGYVVDFSDPSDPFLFIVENEIVSHDPFKHIGIQILKFVTSFDDSRETVRKFLLEKIFESKEDVESIELAVKQSASRNIDDYLSSAVEKEFHGLVVIDEARSELHQVLSRINAKISVLEMKKFVDANSRTLYQYDTLYNEYENDSAENDNKPVSPEIREMRRVRRSKSDTIVVPAQKEGFENVFLGQRKWWAVRIGAIMLDKIKFIAAYQVAPISAVTHIAEIEKIVPYKDTGKYQINFKEIPLKPDKPVKVKHNKNSPQGPVYVQKNELVNSKYLEDSLQ
jgi:hypothetical protein